MTMKTLAGWNAQVGEQFAYVGLLDSIWEVIKRNDNGTVDLLKVGGDFISRGYLINSGGFTKIKGREPIGYIGVDADGKPVHPMKSAAYHRKSQKLPPRLYTTPERAKRYHDAVDSKPVFME